jgi:hypothetical protein
VIGNQAMNVSLLAAFDAMRSFLENRWEEDGKQSDDLANLLSALDRDVGRSGQPLDVAQWSDWLDAVLSVQTGFDDVRSARRQIQEDYQKFQKILEMELSAQRRELDRYRADMTVRTWHRVGDQPINLLDGYEAMRAFLYAYWNRGGKQSRDIGTILDGMPSPKAEQGIAQWKDWLKAVEASQTKLSRRN